MALKVIKRYRIQDLEPGMVLGRTLLNEKGQVIMDQGKVILQEGAVISRELIDRLRNWNICVVDVQFLLPPPIQGQASEKQERPVSVTALAADMLERMSGQTVLSALLDRLTRGLGLLYPGDHVFISLLDGSPQRWWVIAAAGSFKLPDVALEQKFRGQDYLSGQTVMLGEL